MDEQLQQCIAARGEVLEGVKAILVEQLDGQLTADQIDPDTPLLGTGLALDSVDILELVLAIDGQFGLRVPSGSEGHAALRSVNSLVDLILNHRRETAKPTGNSHVNA